MASYTGSVITSKPPGEALAYVADLRNAVEWDPSIVGVSASDEVPQLGTRFEVSVKLAGREKRLTYELVELEPPSRAVLRAVTGAAVSTDTITTEPVAAGSQVTYSAELAPRGPLKVLDPLMSPLFRRYAAKGHAGLRRTLEPPG